MIKKICTRCKEAKSIESYAKNRSRPDGHDYYCKDCRNKMGQSRNHARAVAKSIAKYPHKEAARKKVNQLLKKGELTKLPCFICGDTNVHGHHIVYSHPEKVVWLCPIHHSEAHHG